MKTDFHKIESDILVALSDFLPHNQNQIADLIGKNHKVTSTNRVHVTRCLKELKKYLDRVPNELDELGKKWVLKQDIETIRQIVKNYPSLISDLQKSDIVLSLLIDKDNFDKYIGFPVFANLSYMEMDYKNRVKENFGLPHPDHFEGFNNFIITLKYWLSISQSFFNNYLMCDSYFTNFIKTWLSYNGSDYEGLEHYYGNTYQNILFEMFKHSVMNDFIEGNGNSEAIHFIQDNVSKYSLEYLQGTMVEEEKIDREIKEEADEFRKDSGYYDTYLPFPDE